MQPRCINLTFHGIGEPRRELEPGEEDAWVDHETFLAVLDAAAERSDVRITVDDGNESDVEHALCALRDRGLTATFFIVAGRIGTPGFLSEDDIHTLASAGMTIGCHGMEHLPWRTLDNGRLHAEHVDARRRLEAIVQRPVDTAACPFGSYDRRVLRALRNSSYREVYTSDGGSARAHQWLQARNTVGSTDSGDLLDRIDFRERRRGDILTARAKRVVKRWR
jgi:peptidoglycan/xylan/chitin deacetylase (PgdA/CDA1 family)